MRKVSISYSIRHKTFMKNARFNSAIALFESDGCFAGVVTCDPDGVYQVGDIPTLPHEYIGSGMYEVEVPEEYVIRHIAYAHNTKYGSKFAIPVEHRYSNTFVVMKVGEYLQDKFNNEPINLYLQTADSGLIIDSEKDIIVNDRISLPLPLRGREVGRVYGVRNPDVAREIYRNAYRKGLVKEEKERNIGVFYKGKFGLQFNEFGEFFVTYLSYFHPEIVIMKTTDIRETIDTYNFLLSLYYSPSEIIVVREDPLEDPLILKEGDWVTAINISKGIVVQFSLNDKERLFQSANWNEEEQSLVERALTFVT